MLHAPGRDIRVNMAGSSSSSGSPLLSVRDVSVRFGGIVALDGVSFDDLREGERVSFTEGRGQKGPCAENVKLV